MGAQSIYLYRAGQARVLHGHLLEARVDLGFGLGFMTRIRLAEYAAPEPFEMPAEAEASRAALSRLVTLTTRFYVRSMRDSSGAYTTVTGRIFLPVAGGFLDVAETLRHSGYGRGGGRLDALPRDAMSTVVHAVEDPARIPL